MSLRFARIAVVLAASMALSTAVCAQTMQQLSTDITELVRDAVPSVVSIVAVRTVPEIGDDEAGRLLRNTFRATGTGFVIEPGYVLTSDTVAANAADLEVSFPDGVTVKGTLAGADPMTNTALIRVEKPGARPLVLGDSDTVKPGALIVSVSNRNSAANLITLGIVSATDSRMGGLDTPVLQISGDIGPGASGGPIFDSAGKVIGMTVAMQGSALDLRKGPIRVPDAPAAPKTPEAKPGTPARPGAGLVLPGKSASGGTSPARTEIRATTLTVKDEGTDKPSIIVRHTPPRLIVGLSGQSDAVSGNTGYAVPSNTIKAVLESLKSGKEIVRGFLGIGISEKDGKIVVIGAEPDSRSAKAGVKTGDVIISVDGKTFSGQQQLRDYVASLKPGDSAKLKVSREGKELELSITVGKRPTVSSSLDIGPAMKQFEAQMRALRDHVGKSGSAPMMPDNAVPYLFWSRSPVEGINLNDAGIAEVGKALMEAYQANVIVTDPGKITGKVSIHLNPKTIALDKALTSICHALGCEYRKDGETYIISARRGSQ